MAKTKDVEQAIEDEFGCYYLIDELPPERHNDFCRTQLPGIAAKSAERLRSAVGEDHVNDLVKVLRNLRNDPSHPLVTAIGEASLMGWADEPEDWHVFQTLLDAIIDHLK
jgi:hypothetical protein